MSELSEYLMGRVVAYDYEYYDEDEESIIHSIQCEVIGVHLNTYYFEEKWKENIFYQINLIPIEDEYGKRIIENGEHYFFIEELELKISMDEFCDVPLSCISR